MRMHGFPNGKHAKTRPERAAGHAADEQVGRHSAPAQHDAPASRAASQAAASASAQHSAPQAAAPASAHAAPDEPVLFGGRRLLSLKLHLGRRERVDIVRQKKQRRSSFSLTRTVAAVALLVLCLASTGSTLAYLTYTTNQAANRSTAGAVYLEIKETTATGTTSLHSGTYTAKAGTDGKKVWVTNPEGPDRTSEVVRVSLVAQVESKDVTGASQFMSETWSAPVQEGSAWFLKGDVLTLYLADDWQDNWTYADGAFYYKKVLNPGETTAMLLKGVTLVDGLSSDDYGTVKVNVFANAIQSTPSSATDPTVGAPGVWNCKVADDGTVTKVTSSS
jgi:hypothetical protein